MGISFFGRQAGDGKLKRFLWVLKVSFLTVNLEQKKMAKRISIWGHVLMGGVEETGWAATYNCREIYLSTYHCVCNLLYASERVVHGGRRCPQILMPIIIDAN